MVTYPVIPPLASAERKKKVTTLILHATAGSSLAGALEALRARKLSYHYIIEKDGKVWKCCASSRVAHHAGKSTGPDGPHCNAYSIGVCFVNRNTGTDPYTQAQHVAAVELARELKKAFPDLTWFSTHYWVSPGRKTDPKGYDVQAFAQETGLVKWKP